VLSAVDGDSPQQPKIVQSRSNGSSIMAPNRPIWRLLTTNGTVRSYYCKLEIMIIIIIEYHNDMIMETLACPQTTLTLFEDNYRCITNFIYAYMTAVTSFISCRRCLHTQQRVLQLSTQVSKVNQPRYSPPRRKSSFHLLVQKL